jgi:hypothetical protein
MSCDSILLFGWLLHWLLEFYEASNLISCLEVHNHGIERVVRCEPTTHVGQFSAIRRRQALNWEKVPNTTQYSSPFSFPIPLTSKRRHWWPQIPIPNSMLQCRHPNTMLGKSSEGSVLRLNSRTSWPFKVSSTTSTTRSICCTLIILIPSSSLRPWLPWGTHPATTSGLFAYLHLDIRVVIADWLGFLTVHLN